MSVFTPYYHLAAFSSDTAYSASLEKERFSFVDYQLGFVPQFLESGVISGWMVGNTSFGGQASITIAFGMGIIGNFVVRTANNLIAELDDNETYYIYLQRKPNLTGLYGPFSSPAHISFTDPVWPAMPVLLTVSNATYSSLDVAWSPSIEPNLSHYIVERSSDGGVVYIQIATPTNSNYNDTGLTENTTYTYRAAAVNFSGVSSAFCAGVNGTTLLDTTPPKSLPYFIGFSIDGEISFIWGDAPDSLRE